MKKKKTHNILIAIACYQKVIISLYNRFDDFLRVTPNIFFSIHQRINATCIYKCLFFDMYDNKNYY
jgi:hypothetical protein